MSPGQLSLIGRAIDAVCIRYNVTMAGLENGERNARICEGRFMLMDFAHSIGVTDEQIGALFNRCTSNVRHARKRFNNLLDTEPALRQSYEALRKEIVS